MKKPDFKTLWALFYIFLKAGTFTFAGGLAMLPVIERDVVEKHKLMPRDTFMEYATLSQTLPGIIAVNCASFVGKGCAGTAGMFAASLGAILPAFVLMLVATIAVQFIDQQGPIAGAFRGIRAASAALVLSAAFSLGRHNIKSIFSIVVMSLSFALIFFLDVSALLVVLGACAVGIAYKALLRARKGRENNA